jgi:hypothetical protein
MDPIQETTPQEQKKQNSYRNLGLAGAGIGLAGAGLLGASRAVLSDNDYEGLTQFKNTARNNWLSGQDPRKNIDEYVQYGHKAIAAKPFNVEGPTLMKDIRSPGVMHTLGKGFNSIGLKNQGDWLMNHGAMPAQDLPHYTEFAKSPLDAYRQISKEHVGGAFTPANTTSINLRKLMKSHWFHAPNDNDIKAFQAANSGVVDPTKLPHDGAAQQYQSIKKLIADTQPKGFTMPWNRVAGNRKIGVTSQANKYMDILNKHINDVAASQKLDLNTANSAQKTQLYQKLDSYIKNKDIDFWKKKQLNDYAMGELPPQAGRFYGGLSAPITGSRNALRYAGMGGLALGAGVGGYALYKMLKAHLAKKKLTQQQGQQLPV